MAKGYTEKDTPPGMNAYNKFYGGFTYRCKALCEMVFETPCGLLLKGTHFTNGMMSYNGIDWMPENDNPTVCCPHFGQTPCELNHELLRNNSMLNERIVQCACHKTDCEYDYEQSYDKAHDDVSREADRLFQVFSDKKHGRVCRHCSRYNRATKEWTMDYEPIRVCTFDCNFCTVLQKELSSKKGNVFYDTKITWTKRGFGLFPDEQITRIEKGNKLLKSPVSLTICEAIAKSQKWQIAQIAMSSHHRDIFIDPIFTVEVQSIRAERRESRDMLQDLRDTAEGISVVHSTDILKYKAEQKRERKKTAAERKNKRLEKLILQKGFEGLEGLDQIRAEKYFDSDRIYELVEEHKVPPQTGEAYEQQTLF